MNLKNINWFEQHIEKVLIALTTVFCLAVVWGYVIGEPYAVTIGGNQRVTPDNIESFVLDQADRLHDQIKPDTPSRLPKITVPAYTAIFSQRLQRPPLAATQLDPLGQLGLDQNQFKPLPDATGTAELISPPPTPPPPAQITVHAGYGVLPGPDQLVKHYTAIDTAALDPPDNEPFGQRVAHELASLIPQDQPRDFRFVIVSGQVDLGLWQEMLEHSSIPRQWWNSLLALTQVILERQTYDPAAQRWTDTQRVAPLPGTLYDSNPSGAWSKPQAERVIQQIKDHQDTIARPPFVPMLRGSDLPQIELTPSPTPAPATTQAPSPTPSMALAPAGTPPQQDTPTPTTVWTQDLSVLPGHTYRYRLRVSLVNPLFQKAPLTPSQHEKYFDELSLDSEASPWSDDVPIEPQRQFYVTAASETQQTATVEVQRIYDGRLNRRAFRVHPGDPIGHAIHEDAQQADPVDMSINAVVVDLIDADPQSTTDPSTNRMLYLDLDTGRLQTRAVQPGRDPSPPNPDAAPEHATHR